MKKLLFLGLLLCSAWIVGAVNVTISGQVRDLDTNEPLVGNVVFAYILEDSSAYGYGVADANGDYTIDVHYNGNVNAPFNAVANISDNCGISNSNSTPVNLVPGLGYQAVIDFEIPSCTPINCFFLSTNYSFVSGSTIAFSTTAIDSYDSSAVFTYTWDFGDGATGTGQNPTHTYPQPGGAYTAIVTATSTNCTTAVILQVLAEPTQLVEVSGTVTTPNGQPIPLYPIDIHFLGMVASKAVTDPNGFYSVAVQVPVSLSFVGVSAFNFCWSDISDIYTDIEAPIINGTAVANFTFCESFPFAPDCSNYFLYNQTGLSTYSFEPYCFKINNLPTHYSINNLPAVAYSWDFGDGTISNDSLPSHTYTSPGLYNVLLTTISADSCIALSSNIVFAFGDSIWCPIDTFYYGCQAMFWASYGLTAGGNDPLTLTFEDVSLGTVIDWEWNFGDGTTSTNGPIVTHTYAQEGLYDVTLHIHTIDGCESIINMQVYAGNYAWVEPNCQALFMPIPDSTGTGFFFLDMSYAPTPITSWAWDFGDGATSTEQNPFHTYMNEGLYSVSLTITSDSCNSIIIFDVDTENPFNGLIPSNTTLGLSSVISSAEEPEAVISMQAFPNPVNDLLAVRFESTTTGDATVALRNSMGQLVRNNNIVLQKGINATQMNTAGLASGVYFLQMNTAKGEAKVIKVVKQ
jgi:PKD repeat protein